MFNYWIGPGRIDVAFLGAAQVDRFANLNSTVIGDYDAPEDAPARRRRRARDRGRLRRGRRRRAALAAHVRRAARLRHDGRSRRRAGRARAARLPRPRPDRGDHRPRRARARSRDAGADARRSCIRASRPTRCARRPAGRCAVAPELRDDRAADRRGARRAAGAGRADERRVRLRRGPHAVRPLRRRARRACAPTTSPRTSCARSWRARRRSTPRRIDDVFFGNANGAGEDNRDVARMAVLLAGLPTSVPGDDGQPALRLLAGRGDAGEPGGRDRRRVARRWSAASSRCRARRGCCSSPSAASRPATRRCTRRRSAGAWSTREMPGRVDDLARREHGEARRHLRHLRARRRTRSRCAATELTAAAWDAGFYDDWVVAGAGHRARARRERCARTRRSRSSRS